MSKVTHLAPEILEHIFKLVPLETQIICQFVCRLWHYPAKQVCYYDINLQPGICLPKLINSLESSGDYVHSLTINQHKELRFEELNKLIQCCPSLYRLQIYNNPIYFHWIWQGRVTLNKLKVLSTIGKVSWRSNENNPYFYHVAYQYRQSLEELQIPCTCSTILVNRFGGIMHYLSYFSNLKHLSMVDGSQKVLIYFDILLNTCKKLQSLIIELGHPLYPPINISSSLSTYPSMQQLRIFFTKFCIEYFRYIMARFVNIKVLDVCINQGNADWEKDKQEIYKFINNEYLPFINTLTQSLLHIKMNGNSSIGDLFATFGDQINIGTFINSRFQIDNGRTERTDIKLETKEDVTNLSYIFVRDFSAAVELPYTKHLINYGKRIQSLKIDISKSVLKSLDFGFILNQCPHLKNISIHIEQKYPREHAWYMQVNNLTPNVLYFNHSCFACTVLYLNIDGGVITPDFTQALSKYATSIKVLQFINCSFEMEAQRTQFDMSNLNLEKFILDTLYFYHPSGQSTCLKITTKNCKYYFKLNEDSFMSVTSIATNDITIEFIFNSLVTMEIHVGKNAHKQSIQSYSFQ